MRSSKLEAIKEHRRSSAVPNEAIYNEVEKGFSVEDLETLGIGSSSVDIDSGSQLTASRLWPSQGAEKAFLPDDKIDMVDLARYAIFKDCVVPLKKLAVFVH